MLQHGKWKKPSMLNSLRAMVDISDFVQNDHKTALTIVIFYEGRLFTGVGFADQGGEQGKALALEIAVQDQAAQIRRYQEERQ